MTLADNLPFGDTPDWQDPTKAGLNTLVEFVTDTVPSAGSFTSDFFSIGATGYLTALWVNNGPDGIGVVVTTYGRFNDPASVTATQSLYVPPGGAGSFSMPVFGSFIQYTLQDEGTSGATVTSSLVTNSAAIDIGRAGFPGPAADVDGVTIASGGTETYGPVGPGDASLLTELTFTQPFKVEVLITTNAATYAIDQDVSWSPGGWSRLVPMALDNITFRITNLGASSGTLNLRMRAIK